LILFISNLYTWCSETMGRKFGAVDDVKISGKCQRN